MSTDIVLPKVPDGAILLVGVRYGDNSKVFSYAMLKAGGYWYVTGSGPQAASWAAVQRWLGKDGRVVDSVEVVTGKQLIWSRSRAVTARERAHAGMGMPCDICGKRCTIDDPEPDHPCSTCQCGSDECPGVQVHQR